MGETGLIKNKKTKNSFFSFKRAELTTSQETIINFLANNPPLQVTNLFTAGNQITTYLLYLVISGIFVGKPAIK